MHRYLKYFARNPLRTIVLHLLKRRPMSGIEVIKEIERMSLGTWRPSPGAIYPLLRGLEEDGLVTHVEEKGRKIYRLTDKGEREASIAGFVFPPLDLPDVVDILDGYVDYLFDYVAVNGPLPEELSTRLADIAKRLAEIAGERR